jgi:hypothetical protein
MQAGVVPGGLIYLVLCSLLVLFHHVEPVLYADDTVIVTPSRKPALLGSYLESYLSDLER